MFDINYGKCIELKLGKRQTVAGQGLRVVLDIDPKNAYALSRGDALWVPPPLVEGVAVKVWR